MAKRPKLSYTPIEAPVPGGMRGPAKKLTKHPESILLANQLKFGIKQAAEVFRSDAAVTAKLSGLRSGLIDIVTTEDAEQNQTLASIIEEFTLLGYAAGYAEIQGEIAKQGMTEEHIAFALVLLFTDASPGLEGRWGLLNYSLQSGYILCRSGPASATRLLSTARNSRTQLISDR